MRFRTFVNLAFCSSLALFGTLGGVGAKANGYIALGDSIDCGFVSNAADGTDPNSGDCWQGYGYTELIAAHLNVGNGFVGLAVPDATSQVIFLTQLQPALAAIAAHEPDVVVSLGGGALDLLLFIMSPDGVTCSKQFASCIGRVNSLLNNIESNMGRTLAALRVAAGDNATILLRTQYNPFRKAGCSLSEEVTALTDIALDGLAGRLLKLSVQFGATLVDIRGGFAADPDKFISADCVHPSMDGYEEIFKTVFPPQ